jgi:biopolymer transport protein ExbB
MPVNEDRRFTLLGIIQAAGWPVWPLLLCSIIALALIFERFYSLQPQRVIPDKLLDEVLHLSQRNIPSLESIEKLKKHSALGEIVGTGLAELQKHPQSSEADFRSHVEASGRRVAAKLERYLSALGSIASAAPLLGLFGTVMGMIEIFGSQTPGAGNPAQLAHGISVALYNTAFGLVIAIPSLVAWRHLRTRVDHYVVELEIHSERLVRHFFNPKKGG